MTILMIGFLLVVGHFLCDFPLQTEAIAINKNPDAHTPLQKHVPWFYWLFSHALTHGGVVALITGSVILGIAETVLHSVIDYCKCKGYLNIHQDQALHLICKAVYWGLLIMILV
jgi:hypothetical protein